MKQNTAWKKAALMGLSLSLVGSVMVGPTWAVGYSFDGNAPSYEFQGNAAGETFHQPTSTDQNSIGGNGQIVVGSDGTISAGMTGNQSSGPLSFVELPVGEYPEAYGFSTDVDIAMNSVFPNELGPTGQNSNYYTPVFTPTVESAALPTGQSYFASTHVLTSAGAMSNLSLASYSGYSPAAVYSGSAAMPRSATPVAASGNGAYLGAATNAVAMPEMTSKGAIGRLSIPDIGLNQYVYEGTSQASMRKGIAHFDSTSGWLGNIGLAGHNRGSYASFAKLKDLSLGSGVQYTTAYGTLNYVVSDIRTVAADDTSGLQQDGSNKITMYTCVANQPDIRLKVTASLVSAG